MVKWVRLDNTINTFEWNIIGRGFVQTAGQLYANASSNLVPAINPIIYARVAEMEYAVGLEPA